MTSASSSRLRTMTAMSSPNRSSIACSHLRATVFGAARLASTPVAGSPGPAPASAGTGPTQGGAPAAPPGSSHLGPFELDGLPRPVGEDPFVRVNHLTGLPGRRRERLRERADVLVDGRVLGHG